MENILTLISQKQDELSRTEKVIARFILQNPEQSAMLTISRLAKLTDVGEATIVRFSKKFGFNGYQGLKGALRQRFSDALTASSRFEKFCIQDEAGVAFVQNFIELQKGYIQKVEQVISSQNFKNFCNLIHGSNTIYLFEDGGASASPGNTLEFWLTRFGFDIKRTESSGHRIFDQIINHSDNDILLGFCFGKDNSDLIKLHSYCRKEGIPILLITDYPEGHTASLADHILVLERGPLEIFHSMSVPVLVSEAIALLVAKNQGSSVYQTLKRLDELRKEYHV